MPFSHSLFLVILSIKDVIGPNLPQIIGVVVNVYNLVPLVTALSCLTNAVEVFGSRNPGEFSEVGKSLENLHVSLYF